MVSGAFSPLKEGSYAMFEELIMFYNNENYIGVCLLGFILLTAQK